MKDLSHYRRSYEKGELIEGNLPDSPIEMFATWFDQSEETAGAGEVNTMTLSTVSAAGEVHARIVLLKQFSKDGFTFFTNYQSQKARDMEYSKKVCLSFFWPTTERQVIIAGTVAKVPAAESDAYFATRPRASQLGAWASHQSAEVESREALERKLHALEVQYANTEIPRPPHWGGYIVAPDSIEFWQGRPSRLHDRIVYRLENAQWKISRLSP